MSNARSVSRADIEMVDIGKIVLGQRRRKALGNIAALAQSIAKYGLVHPILLRNGLELVAGQRRLEACRRLGWRQVPARHVETLSVEESRAIEIDENAHRLALSDYESSKTRLAEIRAAEAKLKIQSDSRSKSKRESKRKRGGQSKPGSKRSVAEETGISPAEQVRVEKHVATAEEFPFMQREGWVQHNVLEAAAVIEKIPEKEQPKVAALLDQEGIPPKKAIAILENLAGLPAPQRKEILSKAESGSPHEREVALSMAAALPSPPDPALNHIRKAKLALSSALSTCATSDFKAEIQQALRVVSELEKSLADRVRSAA